MRIAFIYDAVWPWKTGGIQKRVWELSRRLATDHDVHWYGLDFWGGPAVIEREGVTLHGVGPAQNLYVDGRRSITEALSFAARLVRPLRRESFDVIDCQAFPYFPVFASGYGALGNGTQLCLTWHEVWDDYWFEYLGRKGIFGKTVERLCSYPPDVHIAVSERTGSDVRGLGIGGVEVLPNGITMSEIESAPPADREVDVLFVGRFIDAKNVPLLVRTIDELQCSIPDIECVLVGEGPERESIEQLVAERDLEESIDILPFRESYEAVLGLMEAADVFVSTSRREGFGITALEALACGTPVVTIAHPHNAVQELVDSGTGVVCDPTVDGLCRGLLRARDDIDGSACIAAARKYEWDRIAERAEALYRRVA
ncbi:glycosyltransferase family 1 protein [Halobacteriales archaeon QS_4_69_34]|nr:MAG: glycosyltransferase family 1 protein [Halobacteriales archaeon QS_4_69_34]